MKGFIQFLEETHGGSLGLFESAEARHRAWVRLDEQKQAGKEKQLINEKEEK